jgi:hypothetical protein
MIMNFGVWDLDTPTVVSDYRYDGKLMFWMRSRYAEWEAKTWPSILQPPDA